ncbi:MAG: Rossmann-like and DUF2520 domain-containing protein [Rikenellaceae bacterium]
MIIGNGSVAEALAIAIADTDCNTLQIAQIYGRNIHRIKELAKLVGCSNIGTRPEDLAKAELYILAVNDSSISELATQLPFAEGSIVAHTAGSVPLDALPKRETLNRAVIYPMQTFSKGRKVNFKDVPLFIETDNADSFAIVKYAAKSLSNNVIKTSSERRKTLHLGAVFACNFVNAMLGASADILSKNELPLALYEPLINETLVKAMQPGKHPKQMQSGPAVRGDRGTIERHLELLKDSPELIEVYKTISTYIWETSKKI